MNLKDLNNLRADTEGRIKAVFLICMFVLVSAGGFAQNTKSISGTVREKGSNETVIGATVQVKGTHNGVITNENGEYTIKNVSPGQVLVFSMIGMNTVEKTVGSQNRIDVLMDAGVLIDEVVVTGYQTQRKVDLTGSVSSLSSDQFMQTNPLSLEQALKGKISGVQVMNNDGAPGGGITIKIRGASSITAGSSPLNGFRDKFFHFTFGYTHTNTSFYKPVIIDIVNQLCLTEESIILVRVINIFQFSIRVIHLTCIVKVIIYLLKSPFFRNKRRESLYFVKNITFCPESTATNIVFI